MAFQSWMLLYVSSWLKGCLTSIFSKSLQDAPNNAFPVSVVGQVSLHSELHVCTRPIPPARRSSWDGVDLHLLSDVRSAEAKSLIYLLWGSNASNEVHVLWETHCDQTQMPHCYFQFYSSFMGTLAFPHLSVLFDREHRNFWNVIACFYTAWISSCSSSVALKKKKTST